MLHTLQKSGDYEIVSLITTITDGYDRISMHGVRQDLLRRQAASIGLPLREVRISKRSSNEEYESKMAECLLSFKKEGIRHIAFGDLFLEDIMAYRKAQLKKLDMTGLFPIWKWDTSDMIQEFIGLGFKTALSCVDTTQLDGDFAGRDIDEAFLKDLPKEVDPCGENGEFHTFVYEGPIFRESIPIKKGERTLRDGRFAYCDLLFSEDKSK
jgi:uncharacterized protein (TIGR00290 family)